MTEHMEPSTASSTSPLHDHYRPSCPLGYVAFYTTAKSTTTQEKQHSRGVVGSKGVAWRTQADVLGWVADVAGTLQARTLGIFGAALFICVK